MKKYKTFYLHLNVEKDKELIEKIYEFERKLTGKVEINSVAEVLRALVFEGVKKGDVESASKYITERRQRGKKE